MDHYEVVSNVTRSLKSKNTEKQAAELLCKKAYKMGSDDDISAVVIMFEEVRKGMNEDEKRSGVGDSGGAFLEGESLGGKLIGQT